MGERLRSIDITTEYIQEAKHTPSQGEDKNNYSSSPPVRDLCTRAGLSHKEILIDNVIKLRKRNTTIQLNREKQCGSWRMFGVMRHGAESDDGYNIGQCNRKEGGEEMTQPMKSGKDDTTIAR